MEQSHLIHSFVLSTNEERRNEKMTYVSACVKSHSVNKRKNDIKQHHPLLLCVPPLQIELLLGGRKCKQKAHKTQES